LAGFPKYGRIPGLPEPISGATLLTYLIFAVLCDKQGSHSFTDKKIQDFSRTFQDIHEKFSRTFSEPTKMLKYNEKTLPSPPAPLSSLPFPSLKSRTL